MLVHETETQQHANLHRAISVRNLTKIYGNNFKALDDISFDVYEGEIFGLLGPNGAGKTTTIKILTTMIRQNSGFAEVDGIDVRHSPRNVRQIVSYIPQAVSVDGDLTAFENLVIFAKLFYVDRTELHSRIQSALEYMGLAERKNDLAKHFSGGMMRRLEIAQALVNRPKVMILDEPSIGLDPNSKQQICDYIKRVNKEFHTTVLITTHDMGEADDLCNRIAIMNGGRISTIGAPEDLKRSVGGDVITVSLSKRQQEQNNGSVTEMYIPPALGSITSNDGSTIKILCENGEHSIPRLMEYFEKNSFFVESISLSKPSLGDVFRKYAGEFVDRDLSYRDMRATRRAFARRSG
jgi:ABC-2 type transport system ATP-binding protein